MMEYKNIFNLSKDMIVISNGDELLEANRAMLDFFSYKTVDAFKEDHSCICKFFIKREGYIYRDMETLSWLEYLQKYSDKTNKVVIKREEKEYIFTVYLSKIDDNNDYFVTFSDITELENKTLQLSYAIEGTSDGLWDWNLVENTIYFSPRWKMMLGYADDELRNEFATWQERVHPDDLDMALEMIDACLHNPLLKLIQQVLPQILLINHTHP